MNGRRARTGPARPLQAKVRLSVEEHQVLTAAAARAGLSLGAFLAEVAMAAIVGARNPVERGERLELARALLGVRAQLARIGTNLNQVAVVANSTGEIHPHQLRAVLDRVMIVVDRADQAVERVVR